MSENEDGLFHHAMTAGINEIMWKEKLLIYDVKKIKTIHLGMCHSIQLQNILLKPGVTPDIQIHSNISQKNDQLQRITLMFSSKDTDLAIVWMGMPGVETVNYDFDLNEYGHVVIIYSEVQKEYIKVKWVNTELLQVTTDHEELQTIPNSVGGLLLAA